MFCYKSSDLSFVLVQCLLLLLSNSNIIDASRDIQLTKCCSEETFYSQGFDSCRNDSEQSFAWPPSVYSEDSSILIDDITKDDFNITSSKQDCPDGQVPVSARKFKLISDGSLRLEDGRNLTVGQFCLNQVLGSAEIVARFCSPDPCIESVPGCIRKCCPNGMVLSFIKEEPQCQSSSSPSFNVSFKNKLGESVDQSLSSYVVRDGVIPKCIHGIYPLGESFDEPFYVLTDSQIYVPGNLEGLKSPSDYCIDTNGTREVSKKINGLMPQVDYLIVKFKFKLNVFGHLLVGASCIDMLSIRRIN